MKKLFLVSLLLVFGISVSAQCICGKLRFAIDDDSREYSYRFGVGDKVEYDVTFISSADQVHRGISDPKTSFYVHQSYGIYDEKSEKSIQVTFDERKHLVISIDPYEKFIVEITNKDKEKMIVRLTKRDIDGTYNILTDFKPGNFRIDMTEMLNQFQASDKKKGVFYRGSEIIRLRSNLGENRWMKIKDIQKFKD